MISRQQRGFTFVEVLVALVIIAVGVTGLVSLQRTFTQGSVRAAERSAALEIAQHRLELLRFNEYADIVSGSATVARDGKDYQVVWTVTPQYYHNGWKTSGDVGLPNPLPSEPDAKAALVQVSWTSRGGEADTASVEGWLSKFNMRDGGLVITNPPPRSEPKVTYNPGAAPEVIAIKLTDDSNATLFQVKETTRPTPSVLTKDGRRMVTFDTVTYDQATQTQRVEDFATVECLCKFVGIQDDVGRTPQRLILKDDQLTLDPDGGKLVRKMVGEPADSNQPELCVECCRDHHDNEEMVASGNVYREESAAARLPSGDHRHFRASSFILGTGLAQASLNENYLEVCRMRRIDGWYEVYPDWEMQAVTVSTSEYLVDEASNETYANYVRAVIRALVLGEALPAAPNDRDATLMNGSYQLIGRAIYLDKMSDSHLQAVISAIQNGEDDWLTKVPFYEVNNTLLGDWDSSNTGVATVTNEEIETIVDPDRNYYGNYSRGRLTTVAGGTTQVTMLSQGGNTGIIGRPPIHVRDIGRDISSAMNITVEERSGETTYFAVSGEFHCLFNKVTGNTASWEDCKKNDYNGLTISASDLNVTCSFSFVGKSATPIYSCNGIQQGSSLSIQFGSSNPGMVFTPSVISVSNIQANDPEQDIDIRINN